MNQLEKCFLEEGGLLGTSVVLVSKTSYNDSIIIRFNMESGAGFWCCLCSHPVTSVVHSVHMLKPVGNTSASGDVLLSNFCQHDIRPFVLHRKTRKTLFTVSNGKN